MDSRDPHPRPGRKSISAHARNPDKPVSRWCKAGATAQPRSRLKAGPGPASPSGGELKASGLGDTPPTPGAGRRRGGRAADRASRSDPPPFFGRPGPAPGQPPAPARGPRPPAQQVPANADRCPAPPPCPSAAAVARESGAPGSADKHRAEGASGPALRTPRPSRPSQPAGSAPHLGAFNAELRAAERRRGPTASLAAAPARPPPAPCPALLSGSGPAPCPTPLGPDASAQPPGAKWLPYLSVKDVLPGALGRPHCSLPIKSAPLGWGSPWPSPYVTAPGVNCQSRKSRPPGGEGTNKQAPGRNWSRHPPVITEPRPRACAWPPRPFREAVPAGFPRPGQGGAAAPESATCRRAGQRCARSAPGRGAATADRRPPSARGPVRSGEPTGPSYVTWRNAA